MHGVNHKVVLLSFLLLFVNPCTPEQAERENSLDLHERDDDGGDVHHAQVENQQTLVTNNKEDGHDSIGPQKDGHSVRFACSYFGVI